MVSFREGVYGSGMLFLCVRYVDIKAYEFDDV